VQGLRSTRGTLRQFSEVILKQDTVFLGQLPSAVVVHPLDHSFRQPSPAARTPLIAQISNLGRGKFAICGAVITNLLTTVLGLGSILILRGLLLLAPVFLRGDVFLTPGLFLCRPGS